MSHAAAPASFGRKLRLARGYLAGGAVWCSWQVTRRCEAFCLFCEHRPLAAAGELDLAGCARVVAALDRLGSLAVSLTGGDPFLRSDLPEIVALIARRHFPLVTTHGWHVTPPLARELWRRGLVAASVRLQDTEPERHDAAAGLAGSHARALEALRVLGAERTAASQRLNVKVRLGASGAEGLEGLLRLAARHGASVTVEPAFPVAAGEEAPKLASRLVALKRRHPNLRSGRRFLARIDEARARGIGGCRAGRAFLNVDHRGRVSKCIEFQGPADRAGDLLNGNLQPVWRRLRELHQENECRSCWYAFRGEVEGLYGVSGLLRALPALLRS